MKNLILLIIFLAFVTCRNSFDLKEKACPQYEKGSYEYVQDSFRKGLGFAYYDRGNLNKAIDMDNFDTIYRYRGTGGWGEFDYMCSIYKQFDTPQYKVQLLRQRGSHDTMYDVSEKNLTFDEWIYLKKKFEVSNFWCYGISKEGKGTDSNLYNLIAKEKEKKRHISWREEEHLYDTLRGLGIDMLELADYPLPYALVYCKKKGDSISVEILPVVKDYNLVKKYDVKTNLKGGMKREGVFQLVIHKKDFDKIKDIEIEIEFYNNKIRRTNEKKIEKVNF